MIRRRLGKTEFLISPVVYGGIISMEDGQENSDRYVSSAIDSGINYFDVAPSYGDAQEKLGNSLRPYRGDVYLACKTGMRDAKSAQVEMEKSFKLLHTDYFDVYQLHSLTTEEDIDIAFGEGGIMDFLVNAKAQGKIRNISFSAHNEEIALKAISMFDFSTVLFPLNWGTSLGKGFGNTLVKKAKELDMGILGMKTLIHRAWIDDSEKISSGFTKSWCKPIIGNDKLSLAAMKYTLSLGADTLVPPGNFENFSFILKNIDECLKNPLNADDLEYLKSELVKIDGRFFF